MNRDGGDAAVPAGRNHATAKEVVVNPDKLKEYLDNNGLKHAVIRIPVYLSLCGTETCPTAINSELFKKQIVV